MSFAVLITAFHTWWLAVRDRIGCAWMYVGERVLFDAQFKVGWYYLFMPLLFLFPLRVRNSCCSILGRSRLTQTESIASQLNETHAWAHTINLPSWLLFVGPSYLRLKPSLLFLNLHLFAVGLTWRCVCNIQLSLSPPVWIWDNWGGHFRLL